MTQVEAIIEALEAFGGEGTIQDILDVPVTPR
jgi:hypothetical protein